MNKYAIGMAAAIDFFIPPNVLGRIRTISSRRNFQMSVKDVPRGTANCDVLQEGRKISDHQHVSRTTPLQTKIKEFAASKAELGTPLAPDVDKKRQTRTSAKRREKGTRPL